MRIVVKVGTHVLVDESGNVDANRVRVLVEDLAQNKMRGHEIILVSSGAVGIGRKKLGLLQASLDLSEVQACAAAGQANLVSLYQDEFETRGMTVGQLLLTTQDFSQRSRYLNLRNTLETLLKKNAIPIINENDTVSTQELSTNKSFGDNDQLSAIVAAKLDAELLVILTDVAGVFDKNPKKHKGAQLQKEISEFKKLVNLGNDSSEYGRGGIASKIEAAKICSLSGVTCRIGSGLIETPVSQLIEGSGTLIQPVRKLSGKQKWIGYGSGYEGAIQVNDGAETALRTGKASLLPVGVVKTDGKFASGQVVSIQNSRGEEIARGITNYEHAEVDKIQGKQSKKIPETLKTERGEEVVHRDNLVLLVEVEVENE